LNTFLEPNLLEIIASDLGVDPSFVEKDWYAIRIIASLIAVNDFGVKLVLSGGTSLSKGFKLIKRFSEDLDFKVILPEANPTRKQRSTYRSQIVEVIRGSSSEWSLDGEPKPENENRKFTCNIRYKENFEIPAALRPYIKLDVNFILPTLPVEERPLQSFIAQAMDQPPEVPLMACVSPIETAAEKLSALTWRVLSRNRGSEKDDPSLIRPKLYFRRATYYSQLENLQKAIEDYNQALRIDLNFVVRYYNKVKSGWGKSLSRNFL